ncbi:MAG: alkaline phosphatase D family protein [Sedimentisphaerales bacterium]|nr:alkaline phosphatase D family protein [Sedimentisphaerales bacterium]
MGRIAAACWVIAAIVHIPVVAGQDNGPFMADGIKIGEARQDSAIVWTRLTRHRERNIDGLAWATKDDAVPRGRTLDDMEGSVPGAAGEVRVIYWPCGSQKDRQATPWQAVDPSRDFTYQFTLHGLAAGTQYQLEIQGRPTNAAEPSCTMSAGFKTAPQPDAPARVAFTVVTCQEYPRRDDPQNGHRIYSWMRKLDPDFVVNTGDIEYYDRPLPYARSRELARFKWNRIFAMPFQRDLHAHVAAYFMKDDHDTLKDDCWPGQSYGALTWEQGLAVFREQVPIGEKTYRTIRWGRDLQIWLVEGRDFRSPNDQPDGPDKTIWGREQKQWFFQTVRESNATFRILISPAPLVGPDRQNKNDSYANKGFTYEGRELRNFIGNQKNMYIVCGDRHWQYVSSDPDTGVREYACGPSSDQHAGGFSESMRTPVHHYLKICGGFLMILVEREQDVPSITFRHYSTTGTINHEDTFTAK